MFVLRCCGQGLHDDARGHEADRSTSRTELPGHSRTMAPVYVPVRDLHRLVPVRTQVLPWQRLERQGRQLSVRNQDVSQV